MGYTTEFEGAFQLDKPLTEDHAAYLKAFAETRRMKRDAGKTALRPDPVRVAAGLPVGADGAFFVGEGGFAGQARGDDVLDANSPGGGQPSLWCQWVPTEDGTGLEWDEGEKFRSYKLWLTYIIENFLTPWGYTLTGMVDWRGEDHGDVGTILVEDGAVI